MERGRRAVVADDHGPTRTEFALLLRQAGFAVVAEFANAVSAVAEALRLGADLCVLDVHMPGGSGIDAAAAISQRLPETRIVLITASPAHGDVADAIQAGAHAYLSKDVEPPALVEAFRRVAAGETIFPAQRDAALSVQ